MCHYLRLLLLCMCTLPMAPFALSAVFEDVDQDCDIDLHDYAIATVCASFPRAPDCLFTDLNDDGNTTVLDVAYLAANITGPGVNPDAGPCPSALVGTFYGGWARNRGNYIWTRDHGQGAELVTVGDVNGDGYEDAITATNGVWEVSLSESYVDLARREIRHFGTKSTWLTGFGSDADRLMVGDLDGDQKSDLAAFDASNGSWSFATSNGHSFIDSTVAVPASSSSSHQFWADVTGNGWHDAVTFAGGVWRVRINHGRAFGDESTWINSFGSAASLPLMADVDGDGDADAVVIESGAANVALANGAGFSSAGIWHSGLSFTEIILADATGDQLADLVLYHEDYGGNTNVGRWEVCTSNGSNAFDAPVLICSNHGSLNPRASKGLPAAHRFFTGHVQTPKNGDYGVSPIAFNNDYGHWQIMPPYGLYPNGNWQPGSAPNWYCSWQYNNRAAIPRIGNDYFGFDAELDSFALAELVRELALAEIDFVLLDQTNPWNALLEAHQAFALEISKWNAIPGNRVVKYAICGKYKNYASEVEVSAANTITDFLEHPTWGGRLNYQYLEGKPLLVCFGGVPDKHIDWPNYSGPKTNANRFTLKWMDGNITTDSIGPNKGDWYGWWLPEGTIENSDQMVVQPGFYNGNLFTSRWLSDIEGDQYRKGSWDKLLRNLPDAATVISFVGDPEQNDVYDMAPGLYPYEMGNTEHWSYPEMYWEMTKDYIQTYRQLYAGKIEHIAEYGRVDIDQAALTVNFTQSFPEPPVVFACVEGTVNAPARLIRATLVTENLFIVTLTGVQIGQDRLNWLAVRPGAWETIDGLELAAGTEIFNTAQTITFPQAFDAPPAVFSMLNTSLSGVQAVTLQSSINTNAVDLVLDAALPIGNETVGWIAIETDRSDMWSGRLSAAQVEINADQTAYAFNLPRYFYDSVLTLVKSSTAISAGTGDVIVDHTTNLGGEICYQAGTAPQSDILNLFSIDGAGGSLYGKPLD
jgi:hypothetical protein